MNLIKSDILHLKSYNKGFTIIEILTVLTIGAVIMGLAFVAITLTQRSGRNTNRIGEINGIAANIQDYINNNNGAFPKQRVIDGNKIKFCSETGTITYATCIAGNGAELPLSAYSGSNISIVLTGGTFTATAVGNADNVVITEGATCGANGAIVNASSTNKKAITIQYATETASGVKSGCRQL